MNLVIDIRTYAYYPPRISFVDVSDEVVAKEFNNSTVSKPFDDYECRATRFLIKKREDFSEALKFIIEAKFKNMPDYQLGDLKKLIDDHYLGEDFFKKFLTNAEFYLSLKAAHCVFKKWDSFHDYDLVTASDPSLIYWIWDNSKFQNFIVNYYIKNSFKFDKNLFPFAEVSDIEKRIIDKNEKERILAIKMKEEEIAETKEKLERLEKELIELKKTR